MNNHRSSILLLIILILASCTGSRPEQGAKAWASARANSQGGEALKLTCEELQTEVQAESAVLSSFSGLFQMWSGLDPNTVVDISELEFNTIERQSNKAIVAVSGNAYLTILDVGSVQTVNEEWNMIKERDSWRWCGYNRPEVYQSPLASSTDTPAGIQSGIEENSITSSNEVSQNQVSTPMPTLVATSTVEKPSEGMEVTSETGSFNGLLFFSAELSVDDAVSRKREILIVDPTKEIVRCLTNSPGGLESILSFSWSTNVNKLVYESGKGNNSQIFMFDPESGSITQLTEDVENRSYSPRWVPGENEISFLSSGKGENGLYLLNVEGGEPRLFVDYPEKIKISNYVWSPDGSMLVYSTDPIIQQNDSSDLPQVFVSDRNSSAPIPIGSPDSSNRINNVLTQQVWSSDSSKISILSYEYGLSGEYLGFTRYIIRSDGTNEEIVGHNLISAAFSPVNSSLAYSPVQGQIFIKEANSSYNSESLGSEFQVSSIIWSPDGTKIAVVGSGEIAITDSDGNLLFTIPMGVARWGETGTLHWSPDGSQIIFVESGGYSEINNVHIFNVSEPNVTPKLLFSGDFIIDSMTVSWQPPKMIPDLYEIEECRQNNFSRDMINAEYSLYQTPEGDHFALWIKGPDESYFIKDIDSSLTPTDEIEPSIIGEVDENGYPLFVGDFQLLPRIQVLPLISELGSVFNYPKPVILRNLDAVAFHPPE